MQNTNNMIFSINELIAIYTALNSQIDDCNEFLSDPNLSIGEKVQINHALQYSESAINRLNAIFKEQGVSPIQN